MKGSISWWTWMYCKCAQQHTVQCYKCFGLFVWSASNGFMLSLTDGWGFADQCDLSYLSPGGSDYTRFLFTQLHPKSVSASGNDLQMDLRSTCGLASEKSFDCFHLVNVPFISLSQKELIYHFAVSYFNQF